MLRSEFIRARIVDLIQLKKLVSAARVKSKKIVFTNGCFDLLHQGHVDYLAKAAELGDMLVVGLNSDSSVRNLEKGSSRPIQDEQSRALIMASLHVVDAVVIFDEPTPYELIKEIKPDVLVKGGDWEKHQIVGHDIVEQYGGIVTTIDFVPGYSTSSIENKILSQK